MRRLVNLASFAHGYMRANLQGALEYRLSFFSQVFAMLLNDAMWLVFWIAYFDKFQPVAGWGREEIVTLWAVAAAGYGLSTTVCGNLFRLARVIVQGELDFYLALPKPVLPHILISRMNLTAPGDILFGLIGFGVVAHPTAAQWLLFAVFTLTTAAIFVGFGVLTQSITFWLGNAEGLAQQLSNALINFSTYPTSIFSGAVKIVLFTLIPAGFIAYVPVRNLQEFSRPWFFGLLAFTAAIVLAGWAVFRAGLRKYESGNLVIGGRE